MKAKTILFICLILLFSGCAKLQRAIGIASTKDYYSTLDRHDQKDYVDHLKYLGREYLRSREKGEVVKISKDGQEYLRSIFRRLLNNNEILLAKFRERKKQPEFFIIRSETPFYFSVPDAKFFFSSGLIRKYIKNEEMLVSVMAFETVKSVRHIYEKQILIPIGHMGTDRILATTRIPLQTKMEVHKWAYYIMKRSGYDASAYLNWLQTQNKNTVDFILQVGDTRIMSREEFLFKNFIVSQGGFEDRPQNISNSSKDFYKLQKELKTR